MLFIFNYSICLVYISYFDLLVF